ncbi:MAG: serine hydrolase [Flavobacteriaceae bacterium]|nr:serine hydrolase [Bacteroidia bacterium]MBT8270127.1 serine hydrolase [Bacteroidia bacterium]MBT8289000.1 serine hydrolase [Bacteroidia bacterium]NNF76235.1 serine hydrolase [Flavobacteriaceae bacterium]
MLHKRVLLPFVLILSGLMVSAQPIIPDDVKSEIKNRVENGINPSIVIGIINADGTDYYSYGKKSLSNDEPVNENSIYEIGSISKTFTGVILAQLVKEGKVKLDDPLQKYLPEGVTAPTRNGASINLVHMSNHTSALPRMPDNFSPADPSNPYVDYSEEQLYEFLNGHELRRDIGSEFEYSNYAVGLLGHVLARSQSMTYEELMVNIIANPLGMKNTRIEFTSEMKRNKAIGTNGGREVSNWDLTTLAGAGAIRSDVVDMLKYLSANMGLTKTKLYPAMKMAQTSTVAEDFPRTIGLGWITRNTDTSEIIWHNGGTGGYRAFSGFTSDGKTGVVVLTNSSLGVDDIGFHTLDSALEMRDVKPSIANALRDVIDAEGIDTGIKSYWKMKEEQSDKYNFAETQLNNLGYDYMMSDELDKALAVFQLNVEAYPESFNAYDSLGEAFMKKGMNEKAIMNYKKSVEMNPGNDNGISMLKKLGFDTTELEKKIEIASDVLDSYLGRYALSPNFVLTVTRDGDQLMVQATGQSNFPVFAKSKVRFYYKVVEAEIEFFKGEDGKIESMTLFQGGQEMKGIKIED